MPKASTIEKETKKPDQKIDDFVLNEALMPNLSLDDFTIMGETIKIMPLKLRYQIQFAQIVAPYSREAAQELQYGLWLPACAIALDHIEILPKLIALMAKNDGVELDYEKLLDSNEDILSFASPVLAFAAKSERIGKPVMDFFMKILPSGLAAFQKQTEGVQAAIVKMNTASTTSLKASANNTVGLTPTSATS